MKNLKEITIEVVTVKKKMEISRIRVIIFDEDNEIGYYEIYTDSDTEQIYYCPKNTKIEDFYNIENPNVEEILPLFKRDYEKELNTYIDENLEKKGFYIKEKNLYNEDILLGC